MPADRSWIPETSERRIRRVAGKTASQDAEATARALDSPTTANALAHEVTAFRQRFTKLHFIG